MDAPVTSSINEERLNQLLGKAVNDFGATVHAALVVMGDRLGLYKAMADGNPVTPSELAERTGTVERYVREWLNAGAASGYVDYDPDTRRYRLSPEQALMFADEGSPAFFVGAFQVALAATKSEPRISDAFRTGAGVGWHEHDHNLYHGTERFFRTAYAAHLVTDWIPALDGVEARLRDGAKVADVGCGLGSSTVLMAKAYPRSAFVGFDYHEDSVATARRRAEAAGVADRVTFEVATAKNFPDDDYDFVTVFDALHDMGDPMGAAGHIRSALAEDGSWMIVEPYAGDRVEENLNPVGRAYYSASTLLCTPCSLSQEVGLALGAQAGEARLRDVVIGAGFSQFRRATQTPFNLVFEARP